MQVSIMLFGAKWKAPRNSLYIYTYDLFQEHPATADTSEMMHNNPLILCIPISCSTLNTVKSDPSV